MSWSDEEMLSELSKATATTIAQLRAAFALQKMYRRDAKRKARKVAKAGSTGEVLDLPVRTDTKNG